jgi:threonylcarbamoyladenosine tRNA methylthiotransferase MtaB
LRDAGFSVLPPGTPLVEDPDGGSAQPDVVIVNTCAVTANAARKSRQTTRKLRKLHPNALIVATGCDCVDSERFWNNEPSVDLTVPNTMKPHVADLIISRLESPTDEKHARSNLQIHESRETQGSGVFRENAFADFPFLTKAYLKVQEGCDAFCSYCIVPHVRGRERSRAASEILEEAKKLLDDGHKELVLTGVNITTYHDNGLRITDLVSKLSELSGDFRIRLSSLEPGETIDELLNIIRTNTKICRFLHVPLQHGTDEILKTMNRPPESAKFAEFTRGAAAAVPGIHLGTDIIAGFPGETEELFEKSYELLSTLPLANIHVFAFSPREGTPAANFADQVPKRIAKERADRLKKLSSRLSAKFADSQKGEKVMVLLEKETAPGIFEGWSDNYLRTTVTAPGAAVGDIITMHPNIVRAHNA